MYGFILNEKLQLVGFIFWIFFLIAFFSCKKHKYTNPRDPNYCAETKALPEIILERYELFYHRRDTVTQFYRLRPVIRNICAGTDRVEGLLSSVDSKAEIIRDTVTFGFIYLDNYIQTYCGPNDTLGPVGGLFEFGIPDYLEGDSRQFQFVFVDSMKGIIGDTTLEIVVEQ